MTIDSFTGPHAFLSNFYPAKVTYDDFTYNTAEHAYQAAKTLNRAVRNQIALQRRASDAKRLGNNLYLRPGWNGMRVAVMETILRSKFAKPDMRTLLVATHPHHLVEGNWWYDTFWGVCNGKGLNHLGSLLMQLRGEYLEP